MTNEEERSRAHAPSSERRQSSETTGQNPQTRKDIWDKLSTVSTFLSGVLIATIGLLFTYLHNERESQRNANLKVYESRIAETQTFEKFIPYLNSAKEEDVTLGIIGISSLNKELGGRILVHFYAYGTGFQKKVASAILAQRKVNFFNNWNLGRVENTPEKRQPAVFTITRPFIITDIRNYHYNGGKGSYGTRLTDIGPAGELPATITLRSKDGAEFGPWVVPFPKDRDSTAWYCTPNIVLPPGEYEIVDSDSNTWSLNKESKYVGMSIVWGFALE
jgi:hypothetical protein